MGTACGREITEPALNVPPPTMQSMEPMLLSFAASPLEIASGQSSVLTWTTHANCTRVEITGLGEVARNGSVAVSPRQTTRYCLTADGPVRLPNSACLTVLVK